jgi:hypothetical protein
MRIIYKITTQQNIDLCTSADGRFKVFAPADPPPIADDEDADADCAVFGLANISFTSFLNVVATPSRTV